MGKVADQTVRLFQSTPPQGGRPNQRHRPRQGRFNPRPRRGGDEEICQPRADGCEFQSTPPQGGRPLLRGRLQRHPAFQSTPPQGGRHGGSGDLVDLQVVSIHAPAGGATRRCHDQAAIAPVSIHAPAGGATGVGMGAPAPLPPFQSTPPQGGRLCWGIRWG